MSPINKHIGYEGIYLNRSGENARQLVEVLIAPPEFPLNDEQMHEVQGFENDLYATGIEDFGTVSDILRSHKPEETVAPMFFAEAFIKGRVDISHLDQEVTIPTFATHQDVYKWLALHIKNRTLEPTTLAMLAKSSQEYYQDELAAALEEGRQHDPKDSEAQSLILNPDKMTEVSQGFQALRNYLLELRDIYKEGADRVDGAKRAVVDVYLSKTNEGIAEQIPYEDYLHMQALMSGDEAAELTALSLIPKGLRAAIQDPERRNGVLKRLDYLRNGMGVSEEGASPLSDKLQSLSAPETNHGDVLFSPEEKEILQHTKLSPSDMQVVFTNVLRRAGKLSSEDPSTWSPHRINRAADGLFQVVINPNKSTFEVDSVSGVYMVPRQDRSIYDALVVGGSHELAHIDQADSDERIASTLKIAALKGKRVSGLREAGANIKQRQTEKRLFGTTKPVALTYAKALEALESSRGSLADAAKAFYDEKRRIMPNGNQREAAKEAADRVLRLKRGGGISSRALVYAEEGILSDELAGAPQDLIDRATEVACFDLVDQQRLHKYGLIPESPTDHAAVDWAELTLDELRPFIDKALSQKTL